MSTPVALFVYNRADNTRQTLQALMQNTLAHDTDLYVFSDGGRDKRSWAQVNEVRDYIRSVQKELVQDHRLKSLTLVCRSENIYLERNITEGIAEVFKAHDTVVVLEDDIVTSPYFLQYINEALTLYRDEPRVMHVAGFTNLDLLNSPSLGGGRGEAYFTPHMSGWGWATWRDRWQAHFHHCASEEEALSGMSADDQQRIQYGGVFPCLKSLKKRPIPWDICWEIAIYKAGGLCLTPAHTLVRNIGLTSGTHFRSFRLLQWYEFDREPLQRPIHLEKVVPQADPAIEAAFARAIRDWGIRYTWLGRIVRSIYNTFR